MLGFYLLSPFEMFVKYLRVFVKRECKSLVGLGSSIIRRVMFGSFYILTARKDEWKESCNN